jgi:hypothetical protein
MFPPKKLVARPLRENLFGKLTPKKLKKKKNSSQRVSEKGCCELFAKRPRMRTLDGAG